MHSQDKSRNVTHTAYLIFIRDIDSAMHLHHGELASWCTLKCTTTGKDFFLNAKNSSPSSELGRKMCEMRGPMVVEICMTNESVWRIYKRVVHISCGKLMPFQIHHAAQLFALELKEVTETASISSGPHTTYGMACTTVCRHLYFGRSRFRVWRCCLLQHVWDEMVLTFFIWGPKLIKFHGTCRSN
jgi:hypothetical protein